MSEHFTFERAQRVNSEVFEDVSDLLEQISILGINEGTPRYRAFRMMLNNPHNYDATTFEALQPRDVAILMRTMIRIEANRRARLADEIVARVGALVIKDPSLVERAGAALLAAYAEYEKGTKP